MRDSRLEIEKKKRQGKQGKKAGKNVKQQEKLGKEIMK